MWKVVKLDLSLKTDSNPSGLLSNGSIQEEMPEQQISLAAMIEISLGRMTIHIASYSAWESDGEVC